MPILPLYSNSGDVYAFSGSFSNHLFICNLYFLDHTFTTKLHPYASQCSLFLIRYINAVEQL